MTNRDLIKNISLKVLNLPIISKEDFRITSGAFEIGRKITFRYSGNVPLTKGSQVIVDTENEMYRLVVGKMVRPHGKYATIKSRVQLYNYNRLA